MLETLERQHGEQEKALQHQAAQLTKSLDTAGGLARVWRYVSGRTWQEKESLAQATARLEAIRAQKAQAHADFERDRQARFAALRQEEEQQNRRAAEAVREPSQAQAAGDTRTRRPAQRPSAHDRESRRREFFRQRALQWQREQAPERTDTSPPIAPQFNDQTSALPSEHQPPDQDAPTPEGDAGAEARRAAFLERRQRSRSQDRDGPEHDR